MQNNPACPIRGNAGTDLVAGKLRLQVTQHIPSKGKKKQKRLHYPISGKAMAG